MNVLLDKRTERRDTIEVPKALHTRMLTEIATWVAAGLRLERPHGSALHHLRDAVREGRVASNFGLGFDEKSLKLNTFVVQHNWAAAFEGADEFALGDFKVPYEDVVFEFRVSGKRVLALLSEDSEIKALVPFVELSDDIWIVPEHSYEYIDGEWYSVDLSENDQLAPLKTLMTEQIRAVCISLEAQVAVTDIVQAPERLNRSRIKRGRAPLPDYQIVRLNHQRSRVMNSGHASGEGGQKRLHFRRGHWRHFSEERKTWIRWMLVGNPDLGFVDKEYRL